MKFFAIFGVTCLFALSQINAGEQYQSHCPSHDKFGYIFGYGGLAFGPEADSRSVPAGTTLNFVFEDDYNAGGGIGFYSHFLGGSRFEVEGLFSRNELESLTNNGVAVAGATGNLKIGGGAVNLLKEFRLGRFTPYIGGGIGYGSVDWDLFVNGVRQGVTSDSKAIYQGIFGTDICISPCLSFFTQYKILTVGDTDWTGFENGSISINNVSAGLRWSF